MTKKTLCAPRKATAAIALMESGISDLAAIARAVGLTLQEVRRVEAADDARIRRVAVQRVPNDFVFRLRVRVTCPRCGSRIFLAPCLTCRVAESQKTPGRLAGLRS